MKTEKSTIILTFRSLVAVMLVTMLGTMLPAKEVPTPGSVLPDSQTIFYYVAPNGNNASPGTSEKPFATFDRAVLAVRETLVQTKDKPIIVFFKAGEYRLKEPVRIDGLCSQKPILFQAEPGAKGKVIFNGGRKVSRWTKLTASDVWRSADPSFQKRVRPESREHIFVADLRLLEVDDFGDVTVYGKRPELFCNGQPQQLARWPNKGFAKAGKACGFTKRESWSQRGFAEGIFEYADQQPLTWNNEPDAVLFGYWFWDWAAAFARLDKIDVETKTIHLKKPYHEYGYKSGLRYYGFNMLAELDAPGEYYIDTMKKHLFWIPPVGTDPNSTEVSLTCYAAPSMLEITNCEGVTLFGLTFTEGRSDAIHVTNCTHTKLSDLKIERFGRDAIHLNGGKECGIWNCQMKTLGCGGVSLSGGDRRELIPANHYIKNSTICDFSRIKRTYAPAVSLSGCGFHVANCHFSESSSSAISIAANDALIEYNRFDKLVRESDDQGGIDSWYNPSLRGNVIRYNWWEDIVGGTHCGAAAIRLDDMISGFHIYGNVFVRCGARLFGAVQIHGGKDNLVNDNVFIDCHAAVSFSSWGKRYLVEIKGGGHGGADVMKRIYKDVDIRSEKWQKRYPDLAHIEENPDVNTIEKNLVVNGDELFLRKVDAVQTRKNRQIFVKQPDPKKITSPEFLRENGIASIPIEKIGPDLLYDKRVMPDSKQTGQQQGISEFRSGELWPDNNGVHINAHGGGFLVHEGRYWWFGEHKVKGELGNTAQVGVHCYSSKDLYNWKDEGIALKVSDDPKSDIVRGSIIERPKVLYNAKTKKFVMWFHLEKSSQSYSSALSGIAVSDHVTGPYRFVRSLRPNVGDWPLNVPDSDKKTLTPKEIKEIEALRLGTGYQPNYPKDILYRLHFKEGQQARDMTLFQDEDGKAYHIYSSELNGVLHIAELTEDYLDHNGRYVRAFPGRFYEAPAVFKYKGKYYLFGSGCTGWAPNAARLAVADHLFGPWKELGNPCRGTEEQKAKTFYSQSTFVLHVPEKNKWIFIADRWRPENAIDGRYIWLPIQFDDKDQPFLQWFDSWKL